MKRLLAALLLLAACTSTRPPCSLPERDRVWIDRSLDAWRFTSREIMGVGKVPDFEAFFFGNDCLLRSPDALTSRTIERVKWIVSPHDGTIALPDSTTMPARVTSFTAGNQGKNYFVMSTPTVWEAGGVGKGADLDTRMVGVLLHEASHVAQTGPYGPRLGALIERNSLPDSFSDDSLQHRFGENAEFTASIKEETRLFLEAAAADDDAEARRLAREARRLMRERAAKWQVGADAYFVEAEDIWLTFEGAGQWTAFQWLIHPEGGAQPRTEVLERFVKGRFWSQTEGFALFLALDRIIGPAWKRHAYGDGAKTALEMLDEAIREK
jgi:hypothetical protein